VIRTPDQRLRVFVSSTLDELSTERAAVRAAIERLHLIPVMFEMGARPYPPRTLYRSYLKQSHVFIGIYWQRYGWVAPDEAVSGLEDEYRLSRDMPRLLYLKKPAEREPRLEELIDRIRADDSASYKSFETPDELAEMIERDLIVLLTERFAEPNTAQATRVVHPPVPINELFGREDDLARVAGALLGGSRLVAITGTGGMGKSRLALEVVRRVEGEFAHGTVFVPLEPIFDPTQVPRAIAEALGIRTEYADVTLDAVIESIREKHTLLLLDNFEHVIEAAADVATLVDSCRRVQVLVTSRRPLRVRGEMEVPLGPLNEDAAIALFTNRARLVRPEFAVSADERPRLLQLLGRLDHLPLAIELAAARMRLLDIEELSSRLQGRMEALGSAPVNYPDRQRTMHTTIEWSYNLLDEAERCVFRDLSVFAGGADLDAIEVICGKADTSILEVVDSLLENSLIVRTAEGPSGQPRFAMLNTIKSYAREELESQTDDKSAFLRHVDWFLQLSQKADFSKSSRAVEIWPVLDWELANLAVAIRWCLDEADLDRLAAFARPIWFWLWQTGRLKASQPFFERALTLIDANTSDFIRAELLVTGATVRFFTGDYLGAEELLNDAIPVVERIDDDALLLTALLTKASAQPHLGNMVDAMEMSERALAVARRSNILTGIGYGAAILGFLKGLAGDLKGGRALAEEVVAVGDHLRLDGLRIQGWLNLAVLDVMENRPDDARNHLWLASEIVKYFEDREGAALALEVATTIAMNRGDFEMATRTQAVAEVLRQSIGLPIWPLMDMLKQANVAQLRLQLGEDKYLAVVKEAQASDPWKVLDEVVGGPPVLSSDDRVIVDLSSPVSVPASGTPGSA
jgi:predicted ATPase